MQLKKLRALVKQGETDIVEFKKSTGQLHVAMETVCAFLNGQDGGVVLFGVNNDGKIIGQEIADKTKRDIGNELEKITPHAEVKVDYVSVSPDRYVITLTVKPGKNKPYVYDDRPYIRNQSTTQRMTREKYEHLLHNSHRPSLSWENLTTHKCILNDLDKKRIKQVVALAINSKRLPEHASS